MIIDGVLGEAELKAVAQMLGRVVSKGQKARQL